MYPVFLFSKSWQRLGWTPCRSLQTSCVL